MKNTTIESLKLYLLFWAIDVKCGGVGSDKTTPLSFLCFSVITPLRTKYLVDALWIYVNAIPQTCSCSLEEWKMISKLLVQCAAKESDGKHSFC